MAKNRGEPQKMTHSSETDFFCFHLKDQDFWPKKAKFGHIGLNIGLTDPFGGMPNQ